jgi:hypothetical protein
MTLWMTPLPEARRTERLKARPSQRWSLRMRREDMSEDVRSERGQR